MSSPSRLIVPLDTHVVRLGQYLRLTRYLSPGWKMAAEITASLRAADPVDSVRDEVMKPLLTVNRRRGHVTPNKPMGPPVIRAVLDERVFLRT